VPVRIGVNFSVVVAVVSPDSTYPYVIALRMTHSRYDDRANAIPGKNYISANGNKQLYPIEAPASSAGAVKACVKAFESRSTMWIVCPHDADGLWRPRQRQAHTRPNGSVGGSGVGS
jgi:hypothetical protein